MRTTLEIPDSLLGEAMALTQIATKTGVIKAGLNSLIQREKMKDLKKFYGKIDLEIDLNNLRKR